MAHPNKRKGKGKEYRASKRQATCEQTSLRYRKSFADKMDETRRLQMDNERLGAELEGERAGRNHDVTLKDSIIQDRNATIQEQGVVMTQRAGTIRVQGDTIKDLAGKLQRRETVMEDQAREIKKGAAEIADLKEQLAKLGDRVARRGATIATLEGKVKTLGSLEKKVETLEATVEDQQVTIVARDATIVTKQKRSDELDAENTALDDDLKTWQTMFKRGIWLVGWLVGKREARRLMYDWCAPTFGQRMGRELSDASVALISSMFDYKDITTAALEQARANGEKQHVVIPKPKVMLKLLEKQLPKVDAASPQRPYLEQVRAVAEQFV